MKNFLIGVCVCLLVSVCSANSPIEYGLEVSNNPELVESLWQECQTATNPIHCFGIGLSIANAESGFKGGRHGYFGLVGSKDKSIESWVTRYNKYRYKAQDGYFFYGDRGSYGQSRYCTSEDSSGSAKGCPNGKNNFNKIRYGYLSRVEGEVEPLEEVSLSNSHKPECYFIGYLEQGEHLQLDSMLGRLLEIIRPKSKEKQKIFKCTEPT